MPYVNQAVGCRLRNSCAYNWFLVNAPVLFSERDMPYILPAGINALAPKLGSMTWNNKENLCATILIETIDFVCYGMVT